MASNMGDNNNYAQSHSDSPLSQEKKLSLMQELHLLASHQKGITYPNPVTAAYVIKNGEVISTGVHSKAGEPHAELLALRAAGNASEGATVMVNLEPCTHTGKTPPCAQALVDANVARVIYSMKDPNPKVMEVSSDKLFRHAGISVEKGLLENDARTLNDVFIINQKFKRAFITLKVAKSNDGKIALPGEERVLISGEESNKRVHQIRREHDAICVGVRTIINDNPSLSIRYGFEKDRPFTRVILDLNGEVPSSAEIFKDTEPVIILCSEAMKDQLEDRLKPLRRNRYRHSENANNPPAVDIHVVALPTINMRFSWPQIASLLHTEFGICALLVEGGQMVISSLIKQAYFDKVITITSPVDIGLKGLSWKTDETPDPYYGLTAESEPVGKDVWLTAYRRPNDIRL
jgi:diaminohydroxyphosphoribosylaminopyrimidine deaminase/5-amino-6-(5-phosphoribosylamino)uracil reductase